MPSEHIPPRKLTIPGLLIDTYKVNRTILDRLRLTILTDSHQHLLCPLVADGYRFVLTDYYYNGTQARRGLDFMNFNPLQGAVWSVLSVNAPDSN